MAIDTWQKRRSMMNRTMPWRPGNVPVPDGSLSALDRHQRLYRYAATWIIVYPQANGVVIVYNELVSGLVLKSEVFGNIRCTSEVE